MSIPIEKLLKQVDSYYRLVLVAAQRANELTAGAQPLVLAKSKKVAINALEEISRGKIYAESKKTKPEKSKKASKS